MKKIMTAFLLVSLAACGQKGPQKKAEQAPALAKVGSAVITKADFDREMQSIPEYAQEMFGDEKGREKFLDEIVKKEILYQEALKKGMDKSDDFKKKIEDFKKLTLISELLEKEIMAKSKVSDQDVKDYYDKHKEDFTTTSQIKASHILVKTEPEAVKILERLKKGEKFDALAKNESIDKGSASSGGDLGFFSRGQMVPEFERAAATLKVGEVSKPVKTTYGYHIIKVTDRKTGPAIEFEKVKDIIYQRLSGERQKESFDKYLDELKKTYTVEINKEELAKISKAPEKSEKPEVQKPEAQKPEAGKAEKKEEAKPKK